MGTMHKLPSPRGLSQIGGQPRRRSLGHGTGAGALIVNRLFDGCHV
jgi:hypothetical protein